MMMMMNDNDAFGYVVVLIMRFYEAYSKPEMFRYT